MSCSSFSSRWKPYKHFSQTNVLNKQTKQNKTKQKCPRIHTCIILSLCSLHICSYLLLSSVFFHFMLISLMKCWMHQCLMYVRDSLLVCVFIFVKKNLPILFITTGNTKIPLACGRNYSSRRYWRPFCFLLLAVIYLWVCKTSEIRYLL